MRKWLTKVLCIMAFIMGMVSPLMAMEDGIIAIVNDEVITLKDLRGYMSNIYSQLRLEGKDPDEINTIMRQYEEKGINQLIEDKLIVSYAQEIGLEVNEDLITTRLDELAQKYDNSQKFLEALTKEGLTISDLKKQFRDQLKAKYLVDHEVRSKIFVNPQEVTKYYEANNDQYYRDERIYLESIFVSNTQGRYIAKDKIEQAKLQLDTGVDFQAVMEEFSELPSVGVLEKGQLLPEVEEIVFALSEGEVSDVIEVSNGFYIFQLTGKQFKHVRELTNVKDEIYSRLFQKKFQERYRKWISKLRDKAYVEIK